MALAPPIGNAGALLIAVDDSFVYWAATTPAPAGTRDDWVVMSVAKEGGTTTTLAANEAPITGIGTDGVNVYWTNEDGKLREVNKYGGYLSTLASTGGIGGRLAVVPEALLWTSNAEDGGVYGFPKM